jgi:hypothetical protein
MLQPLGKVEKLSIESMVRGLEFFIAVQEHAAEPHYYKSGVYVLIPKL